MGCNGKDRLRSVFRSMQFGPQCTTRLWPFPRFLEGLSATLLLLLHVFPILHSDKPSEGLTLSVWHPRSSPTSMLLNRPTWMLRIFSHFIAG